MLDLARGNRHDRAGPGRIRRAGRSLPQFSAIASYTRGDRQLRFQPGARVERTRRLIRSLRTNPSGGTGVTASQLIYDFGETINRWQAARVAADAVGENVHVTEARLTTTRGSAFFTARAAKDMVGVARDTLANQEKHLAQVQGFVEVGTHPEIDLRRKGQGRLRHCAALRSINAENSYAVARAMLNQAMGVERSVDYDLSNEELPAVDGEDGQVETLIDDAKGKRPEMVNLKSQPQESGAGAALGARHVLAQSRPLRAAPTRAAPSSTGPPGISAASSR